MAGVALLSALAPMAPTQAAPPGFVAADGATLHVDGTPWRAIGVNMWDFDPIRATYGDLGGCYYQHPDLDEYFDDTFRVLSEEFGVTAVRTFGFMAPFTAGGRDFSSTDKMLHYARKHAVRVVPVLGSQYDICGSVDKPYSWYRCAGCVPGYRKPEPIWGVSYRDYAIDIVRRYRDEPAIAFWQLMNEPDPAVAGETTHDPTALVSFAREMTEALRIEAGDTNHLIQLGTKGSKGVGTRGASYGDLLRCEPAAGGCSDLAEVHVYDFAEPLPGSPLGSWVTARIEAVGPDGSLVSQPVALPLDAWTPVSLELPATGPAFDRWSLSLSTDASSRGWTAYLDEVVVRTDGSERRSTFEADDGSFASVTMDLTRSTRHAFDGEWSLRMDVPLGPATTQVSAPSTGERLVSITAHVRPAFDAPAPSGGSAASNLHVAVIDHDRPFIVGEAGLRAAIPGRPDCANHRSTTDRARAVADMLELISDDEHRAGGLFVWDFKDPSVRTPSHTGGTRTDPGVSCWSITPGDPAAAVLRAAAERASVPTSLPAPEPLGPPVATLVSLTQVPASAPKGSSLPLHVRLTDGGNVVPGALVRAIGACEGQGRTDPLGHLRFSCTPRSSGDLVLTVDPGTCGCAPAELRYPLSVATTLEVRAVGGAAQVGSPVPIAVQVVDPVGSGAPVDVAWSIPACNRSGVIPAGTPVATIQTACAADAVAPGSTQLRFETEEAPGVPATATTFRVLTISELFIDDAYWGCVGLDRARGIVSFARAERACDADRLGRAADWITLSGSEVSILPGAAGDAVSALRGSYAIEGLFGRDGTFAAAVTRPGSVQVLRD